MKNKNISSKASEEIGCRKVFFSSLSHPPESILIGAKNEYKKKFKKNTGITKW